MKFIQYNLLILVLLSCSEQIKSNKKIQDEVMSAPGSQTNISKSDTLTVNNNIIIKNKADLIGNWVGWFEPDMGNQNNDLAVDDQIYWGRENKISLSIEDIEGENVKGHSVVAGNYRPFSGTISDSDTEYMITLKEPGDDKYDGSFQISMKKNQKIISGKWKAYKGIEINKRKFNLTKKLLKYNPNQLLEYSREYVDWTKLNTEKFREEYENEVFEYISTTFSSATESIYSINASNRKLSKKDLENLNKGDLLIIRNTIYARHGFSFKNRPLRIFFDAQEWYIPVNIDIKSNLTEIEKENIQLLLKYEKNAVEYYDSFGRG
jgi:hypothetical protein